MSQLDDRNKESLSAMLDNEADELELRRILKASEQSPELAETWERYNLVQSALHDSVKPLGAGLRQRIAAQIAVEDTPTKTKSTSSWQQGMAKLAVAASVALVFTFAIQSSLTGGSDMEQVPAAIASESAPVSSTVLQQNPQTLIAENSSEEVDPVARQRLRDYIESMSFDEEKPVRMEHIQDSPLFRLVNDLQDTD